MSEAAPKKAAAAPKTEAKVAAKPATGGKIVAILIRSSIGVNPAVRDTLRMLKLTRKHTAVILDNTPGNQGMINVVKDFVTWGEANAETAKKFTTKTLHLHPPRKGFGRKGIKVPFKVGGGLGYRGEAINDLVDRMMV